MQLTLSEASADALLIGHESLTHQILLVIGVALSLATLGRTARAHSSVGVCLLVAWLVLR